MRKLWPFEGEASELWFLWRPKRNRVEEIGGNWGRKLGKRWGMVLGDHETQWGMVLGDHETRWMTQKQRVGGWEKQKLTARVCMRGSGSKTTRNKTRSKPATQLD